MIEIPPEAVAHESILLIRAWTEPAMPPMTRARLLTVDESNAPTTWSTVAGDQAISSEVLRWLRKTRQSP